MYRADHVQTNDPLYQYIISILWMLIFGYEYVMLVFGKTFTNILTVWWTSWASNSFINVICEINYSLSLHISLNTNCSETATALWPVVTAVYKRNI
jgi:hypothetical protein